MSFICPYMYVNLMFTLSYVCTSTFHTAGNRPLQHTQLLSISMHSFPPSFLLFVIVTLFIGMCEGGSPSCTFTKRDMPIPKDALIVGDPRKSEKCQATSFDSTKPADFFDPSGLRMWSREQHSMALSKDEFTRNMVKNEVSVENECYCMFLMILTFFPLFFFLLSFSDSFGPFRVQSF